MFIPRGAGILASEGGARVSVAGETLARRLRSASLDRLLAVELVLDERFVAVGTWDGQKVQVYEPNAPDLWRWLGYYPDPEELSL